MHRAKDAYAVRRMLGSTKLALRYPGQTERFISQTPISDPDVSHWSAFSAGWTIGETQAQRASLLGMNRQERRHAAARRRRRGGRA